MVLRRRLSLSRRPVGHSLEDNSARAHTAHHFVNGPDLTDCLFQALHHSETARVCLHLRLGLRPACTTHHDTHTHPRSRCSFHASPTRRLPPSLRRLPLESAGQGPEAGPQGSTRPHPGGGLSLVLGPLAKYPVA